VSIKNDVVPGVRLDDAQVLSNGAASLLTLHTSDSGEIALLDWQSCGVVYSNAQSLEAGGYQPVAFPTFRAYDFYESEEWRKFEQFSEWYKKQGMLDNLERVPESHAIKLVWMAYKEREKRAVLLLRYFKATRKLDGSRTFWEAQEDTELARRSWVRDALDYVRMSEVQYKEAGFLADTCKALAIGEG
jgi:hypothetical protein